MEWYSIFVEVTNKYEYKENEINSITIKSKLLKRKIWKTPLYNEEIYEHVRSFIIFLHSIKLINK